MYEEFVNIEDLDENIDTDELIYSKDNLKILFVLNQKNIDIKYFWVIKNNKVCRLSIFKPEYIFTKDEDKILNEYDINEIMKCLSTTYSGDLNWNDGKVYKTNWDFIKQIIVDLTDMDNILNLSIPNYKLLLEN